MVTQDSVRYNEDYFTKSPYAPYEDFQHHAPRVDKIIKLANPKSVLDVGCAFGYIVKRLNDRGVMAYGCDISEYAVKRASEIIPDRVVQCDIRSGLPFKDGEFDLLYCEGVLEHIEEESIDFVMKEFDRVAEKRMLAISLAEHPEALNEPGHICVKPVEWWVEKMPFNTLLYLPPFGTESPGQWVIKKLEIIN